MLWGLTSCDVRCSSSLQPDKPFCVCVCVCQWFSDRVSWWWHTRLWWRHWDTVSCFVSLQQVDSLTALTVFVWGLFIGQLVDHQSVGELVGPSVSQLIIGQLVDHWVSWSVGRSVDHWSVVSLTSFDQPSVGQWAISWSVCWSVNRSVDHHRSLG